MSTGGVAMWQGQEPAWVSATCHSHLSSLSIRAVNMLITHILNPLIMAKSALHLHLVQLFALYSQTAFSCLLACLVLLLKAGHDILGNANGGK